VSGSLAIAEFEIPEVFFGKSLIEAELRKKYQLNLLSVRSADAEYVVCDPRYIFKADDVGLFYGSGEALRKFAGSDTFKENLASNIIAKVLKSLRGNE
jgi:trk system potassium uptake protein TrkA